MKKTDFQKTVKDMLMEFYPKGGYRTTESAIPETDPQVAGLPTPEHTDKSECCGAPMEWGGLTPYCTKCGMETEPDIAGGSSLYPYENMHEIYRQFKDIIKEEINEVDFSKKIRGVFYEYASGVSEVTPTTANPTRDAQMATTGITANPDEVAKAMDAQIKNANTVKTATNQIKATNASAGIKEYVDKHMLPAVLEIIKQAENPRATKRELLEFFKLTPKTKSSSKK